MLSNVKTMLSMRMRNKQFFRTVSVIIFMLFIVAVEAQCPMCRMSAESNLANGGSEGAGLNKGILYLLSLPYLLVMFLGFVWYRNRKATKSQEVDS